MKLVDFGRQARTAARQDWELTDAEIASLGQETPAQKHPMDAQSQARQDVQDLNALAGCDRFTMTDGDYQDARDWAMETILLSAEKDDQYKQAVMTELQAKGSLSHECAIVRQELEAGDRNNPAKEISASKTTGAAPVLAKTKPQRPKVWIADRIPGRKYRP
jgi:hypothetical protein